MGPWFDPDESDRGTWTGDDARRGGGIRSSYACAVTDYPLRTARRDPPRPRVRQGGVPVLGVRTRPLQYHTAIDSEGRVKLLERGYLRGDDEHHQRYRAQYRQPGEPADTGPLDGVLGLDAIPVRISSQRERRRGFRSRWFIRGTNANLRVGGCYTPQQVILAQLEPVRNPSFVRHLLSGRDRWQEIDDIYRCDPDLFDVGP